MQFLDSKEESAKLDEIIIGYLAKHPISKQLLIIQIGNNQSSEKYIALKLKFCERLGIESTYLHINENLSDEEISSRISEAFSDPKTGGGIIQLPLPRKSLKKVINLIPANMDIDNLLGLKNAQYTAPIVRAFEHFLAVGKVKTQDLSSCVIGHGSLIGRPISDFLLSKGAKVTVLDETTNTAYQKGQKLDFNLLILSSGVPNLVDGDDIKKGCAVADFGSSVVNGKTVGDLDLNSQIDHLGFVAKSPGGLGPLVVRYLIMNFLGI